MITTAAARHPSVAAPPGRSRGFTLIELAVVLMIVGTLLGVGLSALSSQRVNMAYSETGKNQAFIQDALTNYLAEERDSPPIRRLPCPDNPADGIDGREDRHPTNDSCNVVQGVVPYRDLRLEKEVALDGWNNYITYVVAVDWVNPAAANPAVNHPTQYTEDLSVERIDITTDPHTSNTDNVAAMLISHGENEYGAWTQQGTPINIPDPTEGDFGKYEEGNADGTNLVDTSYTEVADADNNTPFDDAVHSISGQDLLLPLYKDGRLRTLASLQQETEAIIDRLKKQIFADIAGERQVVTRTRTESCSYDFGWISGPGSCEVPYVYEYYYEFDGSIISPYNNALQARDAWGDPITVNYTCSAPCNNNIPSSPNNYLESVDDQPYLDEIIFEIQSPNVSTRDITLGEFGAHMMGGW